MSQLKLKIIRRKEDIFSNPSDHKCYILLSTVSNRYYIGYTIDFERRLRQHNGEITGGAKKTKKGRPWIPLCTIDGFFDNSSALRFEYRLQRSKKEKNQSLQNHILKSLNKLILSGDGRKENKLQWPNFKITWYNNDYYLSCPNVSNYYFP